MYYLSFCFFVSYFVAFHGLTLSFNLKFESKLKIKQKFWPGKRTNYKKNSKILHNFPAYYGHHISLFKYNFSNETTDKK